jgi:hypothetical protein
MRLGGRREAGVVRACDAGSLARTLPIPQTFLGDSRWRPRGFGASEIPRSRAADRHGDRRRIATARRYLDRRRPNWGA